MEKKIELKVEKNKENQITYTVISEHPLSAGDLTHCTKRWINMPELLLFREYLEKNTKEQRKFRLSTEFSKELSENILQMITGYTIAVGLLGTYRGLLNMYQSDLNSDELVLIDAIIKNPYKSFNKLYDIVKDKLSKKHRKYYYNKVCKSLVEKGWVKKKYNKFTVSNGYPLLTDKFKRKCGLSNDALKDVLKNSMGKAVVLMPESINLGARHKKLVEFENFAKIKS